MSDISVIGLGLIGAALARAVRQAGLDPVVRNRSPGRLQPFLNDGVVAASDLASAIKASSVVLICIDNYTTTREPLSAAEVAPFLQGCVVVQFSTGIPKDATFLLSDGEAGYEPAGSVLDSLGDETVRFLGDDPGSKDLRVRGGRNG